MKQDLAWARRHLANGLERDEGLSARPAAAALAGDLALELELDAARRAARGRGAHAHGCRRTNSATAIGGEVIGC